MLELGVPNNHGYFFGGTYGKKYPTLGSVSVSFYLFLKLASVHCIKA